MSVLEMGALTNEFLEQLPSNINAVRVYSGMFETSLNAPAFALTICNLTEAARSSGLKVSDILDLLDAKTDTAWEAVAGNQIQTSDRKSRVMKSPVLDLPHANTSEISVHKQLTGIFFQSFILLTAY
jgi:dihydroxyacetone kinase